MCFQYAVPGIFGQFWTVEKNNDQRMGYGNRLAMYCLQCVLYHPALWPPGLRRRVCNQKAWGSILTHTTLKPFCTLVFGLTWIIHSLQCGLSTWVRGSCVWGDRTVISRLVVRIPILQRFYRVGALPEILHMCRNLRRGRLCNGRRPP